MDISILLWLISKLMSWGDAHPEKDIVVMVIEGGD